MAFYEDIVTAVADSLKCSICFELFNEPVTLACGHNYCMKCIEDSCKKNERKCPQCRCRVGGGLKFKRNVTLCEILGVLGGRGMWEQVVSRSEPEPFYTGHRGGMDSSFTNGAHSEVNSSQDSEGHSQSADDSLSSLSGQGDSMNGSSQAEETDSVMSDVENDVERMRGAAGEDRRLMSAPSAAELGSSGPEVTPLHRALFCRLSFPPHLGNRCLVFVSHLRRMEVRSSAAPRAQSDRFEACQWMAQQEFSGGRHYWDVDVRECSGWALGVASPHLPRDRRLGRHDDGSAPSWCLEKSTRGRLSAWHIGAETPLEARVSPLTRVRVLLDVDEGHLSFWSLPDGGEVYGGRAEFSGVVRPVFWLYGLRKYNNLTFPLPES